MARSPRGTGVGRSHPVPRRSMSSRLRILVGVALLLVLAGGGVIFGLGKLRSPTAYALVDESTLSVLRGEVQLQRAGASFVTVTGDVAVRQGDRIRTGPDGYAVVTYFDGSTTTLDPDTDIILRRLDKLANGGANISFNQEIGRTWNRVEKL